MTRNNRISNEQQHGEFLAANNPECIWNWSSPAGQRRAARRGEFIRRHLSPGTRALELGCGTGLFTRLAAESGADITAMDLSEQLITQAREATSSANVSFEMGDAHATGHGDETFDVVFGSSVLHHLEVEPALSEIHRLLRPGGKLVFVEPNMVNPQVWAERHLPWIRGRLGVSPDETAFVRTRLAGRLEKAGFHRIDIRPHDFLHPATPAALIPLVERVGRIVERLPVVQEISGSLLIVAEKP